MNQVGVDVNTASPALLTYVAGIGPKLAEKIVAHRDEQGPFPSRVSLRQVAGLGPKAFEQSAGFLARARRRRAARCQRHPSRELRGRAPGAEAGGVHLADAHDRTPGATGRTAVSSTARRAGGGTGDRRTDVGRHLRPIGAPGSRPARRCAACRSCAAMCSRWTT